MKGRNGILDIAVTMKSWIEDFPLSFDTFEILVGIATKVDVDEEVRNVGVGELDLLYVGGCWMMYASVAFVKATFGIRMDSYFGSGFDMP